MTLDLSASAGQHANRRPVTRALALAVAVSIAFAPASPAAIAAELPMPSINWLGSGQATSVSTSNKFTINQQSQRAILNWERFNIGPDGWVEFNHLLGSSAATLNRIHDANPSLIQGRLSANGQIYLINRSGIIFAQGAQVNVGSLVASALNINDDAFQRGLLTANGAAPAFVFEGDAGQFLQSLIRIDAGADLRAENGGRILVFAPRVENSGTISTPDGQAILAAGSKIYLAAPQDPALRGLLVEVDSLAVEPGPGGLPGNSVINNVLGTITAQRGNITLAALAVNQSGRVTATTSVNLNGSVRLLARDTVVPVEDDTQVIVPVATRGGSLVLGENSVTEVLPETADSRTILDEQKFAPSRVTLAGRTIHLKRESRVIAPGGEVSFTAQSGQEFALPGAGAVAGVRVYLERGSLVDVSGTADVEVPIERNVIEVELRGTELADSPLQRNSFLRNQKIRVDVRQGTPFANIEGVATQVGRTVAEKTSAGGTISVRSEGDIVMREGSALKITGGSIRYLDGYIDTTKLYRRGKIYDISQANPDLLYEGRSDIFVKKYEKWGVTQIFGGLVTSTFEKGYVEGKNAGTVELIAPQLVPDGTIIGGAVAGRFQREAGKAPLSGQLVIGDRAQAGALTPDFRLSDVALRAARNPLGDFSFESGALPAQFAQQATLSLDSLRQGRISGLTVYSSGLITVADEISLPSGGSLNLTGRQLDVRRNISVPAGQITLATRDTIDLDISPANHLLAIASGVKVSSRGVWINDSPLLNPQSPAASAAYAGGAISISSASDLILGSGSLIDVSGGGWLKSDGALAFGDAGSISLKTGRVGLSTGDRQQSSLVLGGELRAYSAHKGGTLSIDTSSVRIGGEAGVSPTELYLDPGFFQTGGFRAYSINGQDGMMVAAGARLSATTRNLVLDSSFGSRESGSDISSFSSVTTLSPWQRTAAELTLTAAGTSFGNLLIGEGANVSVDPAGSISLRAGRQLTMLGAAVARGGKIALATSAPADTDPFESGVSLWLGANARLNTAGDYLENLDDTGRRIGDVIDGGSITLNAGKGYVVAQAGAILDVSGQSAVLDVASGGATGPMEHRPVTVASHAGSISIRAREGILFDGELRGRSGGGPSAGGSFSATLDITDANIFAPGGARVLTLREDATAVASNLRPGDAIDIAEFNGKGYVSARSIRDGGFDSLSLKSRDRIEFNGFVDLALRSQIKLDAPVISATGGSNVRLDAAYVALGNTEVARQVQNTSSGGDANLALSANLVELIGKTALRGFGETIIDSSGDVRLRGVLSGLNGRELAGALITGGSLRVRSAQLYPTTLSQFTLAVRDNPSGRVVFERTGRDTPVLSAAGRLTVEAPVIDQGGVLKAPLGEIVLNAAQRLTLQEGSRTSVSAAGQRIPFGRTELSGRDYAYVLDSASTLIFATPPEKRIDLSAPDINFAAGATVDLSGGGDLYAYEFIPGPGGSRDVLDPANAAGTFAVLPSLGAGAAPYDHHLYRGVDGYKVGDMVFLSGVEGLPAGYYSLLPARYALLGGAYLVKPVSGHASLPPEQTAVRVNGSQFIAGHRASFARDGSIIRDSLSSGFEVRRGSLARTQSEYLDTFAGDFFQGLAARLPADAGRLAISATNVLALDGNLLTSRGPGGRGAEVDINSLRLAVLGAGAADPGAGYVRLDAGSLARLNAESLLLGGIRTYRADGVSIQVGAEEVLIATSDSDPLRAPELLIAARDRVTVRSGSAVEGSGAFSDTSQGIRIGDLAQPGSGDGVLLRVSAGGQRALFRDGVSRTRGTLAVEEGAAITADGSIILDATFDNRFAGTLGFGANGALALGASRISFGSVPDGVEGLSLSNSYLGALATLSELLLRSYSTVDLYGGPTLGSAGLQRLAIEAAGIGGYANDALTSTLIAQSVSLSNPNGLSFSRAPGALPGSGSLQINAQELRFGPATTTSAFMANGFSTVEATAQREIVVAGKGSFSTPGDLTLTSPRISADTGARYSIVAGGEMRTFPAAVSPGDLPAATGLAATLRLAARRITHAGRIVLPSGAVTLEATGNSATDNVVLANGSSILVSGAGKRFSDTTAAASAGSVTLVSAAGDVITEAGSRLDLTGVSGGDAGWLSVVAQNGTALLDGRMDASAAASAGSDPLQGRLVLDAGSLPDFSALNARLGQSGFTQTRDLRVRSGDIFVAGEDLSSQRPADRVTSRNVRLATDDGDIVVAGVIDASGAKGGSIVLAANRRSAETTGAGNVILLSGAVLDVSSDADPAAVVDSNGRAFGTRGQGGSVLLTSSGTGVAGDVGVEARTGSVIDVSSAGVAANGGVFLRAPRINADSDVLIGPINATIVANAAGTMPAGVVAEAVKVYDGITGIGTTAGTGRLTIAQVAADSAAFMNNAAVINARIGGGARVRTGVEVRSAGDLTLDSDWNLFSSARPGGEPGLLTLRAAGNLVLNGSLSDGFSSAASTATLQAGESWSYRLVGGADLAAADPSALRRIEGGPASGDVVIGAGRRVRTGTGTIKIAAGRDIVLTDQSSVVYTAGVPGAALANFANISIGGANAEFPLRGGDIDLEARGDVKSLTGSTQLINNWLFRQGKITNLNFAAQLRNVAWWPRFREFQQGVGALGGGDVVVTAGGDIENLSLVVPTNGRLPGTAASGSDPARLTVQGGGDLDVSAGGDINSALLYVERGEGRVRAGNNLGSSRSVVANGQLRPVYATIALGDARIRIETAGAAAIDAVVNPAILSQSALNRGDINRISFFSTYSPETALTVTSAGGNVTLTNDIAKLVVSYPSLLAGAPGSENDGLALYPGTLRIAALGGDVVVDNGFQMFPSSDGTLSLLAEGSVMVSSQGKLISVSDLRPEVLPSPIAPSGSFVSTFGRLASQGGSGFDAHSDPVLHRDDEEPIRIVARTGDIVGPIDDVGGAFPFAFLPKRATIEAGRDVRNVWIQGQNVRVSDVTSVRAGRDVVFDTLRNNSGLQRSNNGRIQIGGPGNLEIIAGRNVDLGNSSGIVSRGNLDNPFLPESGARISVRAGALNANLDGFIQRYIAQPAAGQPGYAAELTTYMRTFTGDATLSVDAALARYAALPDAQKTEFANRVFYLELRAAGRFASQNAGGIERYARGFDAISSLFPETRNGSPVSYRGDVNLFFSQIKTEQGGDIDIMAPGGLVNAGLANPGGLGKSASQLGIVTARGGSIRSFVKDDFLVNQSRVFTLQGGDILIWSSEGNIDAGKGAKTARATPPPQLIVRGEQFILDTTNSVAGSGIAVLLARAEVIPGDVDLIAPRGEVNAGDAGIRAAGNINIAAVRVVGADNIQVGGISTGVPAASTGSIAAGLTGVSNLAGDATSSAEQATRALAETAAQSSDLQKSFRPSFITVELLGLGD